MHADRLAISDELWEKIEPLIPGKADDPGVTARNNHQGTSLFDLFCVFFVLWFEGWVISFGAKPEPGILKPVVPRLS